MRKENNLQIKWGDIVPFLSLTIFKEVDKIKSNDLFGWIKSNIEKILFSKPISSAEKDIKIYNFLDKTELEENLKEDILGIIFQVSNYPSWLKIIKGESRFDEFVEYKHHLLLLIKKGSYISFSSTYQSTTNNLMQIFEFGQFDTLIFPFQFKKVKEKLYEDAFITDEVFNLWLNGLHRSVKLKPDKKNITGPDLRMAIDPFADQSYNYGAFISKLTINNENKINFLSEEEKKTLRIGYSKNRNMLWMSRTKGIIQYASIFDYLTTEIERKTKTPLTKQKEAEHMLGLINLSKPTNSDEIKNAKDPFEIKLNIEIEKLDEDLNDKELTEKEWLNYGKLEIDKNVALKFEDNTLSFGVNVFYITKIVQTFVLEIQSFDDKEINISVGDIRSIAKEDEVFENVLNYIGWNNAFQVLFESGHVLTGNRLYYQSYGDIFYKDIKFKDFNGFDVSKEKPDGWDKNSKPKIQLIKNVNDDSLFSFVAKNINDLFDSKNEEWYLLCHDQANEIADFLYIEPGNRKVILVHVKAADSNNSNRNIAIDPFQVVCSQAVKNLRHVNADELLERFKNSEKRCGTFAINSDDPSNIILDTSKFHNALEVIKNKGQVVNKKVIIVQPHIQSTKWKKSENDFYNSTNHQNSTTLRRALMLSTILLETEMACRKQGVEFEVWGEAV